MSRGSGPAAPAACSVCSRSLQQSPAPRNSERPGRMPSDWVPTSTRQSRARNPCLGLSVGKRGRNPSLGISPLVSNRDVEYIPGAGLGFALQGVMFHWGSALGQDGQGAGTRCPPGPAACSQPAARAQTPCRGLGQRAQPWDSRTADLPGSRTRPPWLGIAEPRASGRAAGQGKAQPWLPAAPLPASASASCCPGEQLVEASRRKTTRADLWPRKPFLRATPCPCKPFSTQTPIRAAEAGAHCQPPGSPRHRFSWPRGRWAGRANGSLRGHGASPAVAQGFPLAEGGFCSAAADERASTPGQIRIRLQTVLVD